MYREEQVKGWEVKIKQVQMSEENIQYQHHETFQISFQWAGLVLAGLRSRKYHRYLLSQ